MQIGDRVQYARSACSELGGLTRERAEGALGTVISVDGDRVRVMWYDGDRTSWLNRKFLELACA